MTGALTAITVTVVWAAGYALACWSWPFAACGKCKGSGRRRSPTGRKFGHCRRCKGSGKRLRTGRRVFNYLHILRKEGTR